MSQTRAQTEILRRSRSTYEGCWFWEGQVAGKYGRMTDKEFPGEQLAHRIAYLAFVGPIPDGLTIDHLCGNTLCVNPAHLEPTTLRENIMRGNGICAQQARQTHCKRGHELTLENVYSPPSAPTRRECRTCKSEMRHRRYVETGT